MKPPDGLGGGDGGGNGNGEGEGEQAVPQWPDAQPDVRVVASHTPGTASEPNMSSCQAKACRREPDFYTHAQWSADGTSLVASSSSNTVSVFVLPEDLLDPEQQPFTVQPQSCISLPEPAYAVASAPYFSLHDPSTQLLLLGCKDHPIHLYHAFPNSDDPRPVAAYKLTRRETEEYIVPNSMLWLSPGSHFLTGASNRLDYFDLSRTGTEGLVVTIPTIPSRRHSAKGGGVGMRGTVASLAAQPPDENSAFLIAAGTWTRWVGLYDLFRTGKAAANWSIADVAAIDFGVDIGGQGIVQIVWSPCGRYLAINERNANGILLYDVRGARRPVSVLAGRHSSTLQRLGCDVFPGTAGTGGFEMWAGTQQGDILIWEGVGATDGIHEPSWGWTAHESAIGSTVVHPSGSVVATCSGAWMNPRDRDLEDEVGCRDEDGLPVLATRTASADRSFKIWSVGASAPSLTAAQDAPALEQ